MSCNTIERRLTEYLQSYGTGKPDNLAAVATYNNWQHMAQLELDHRAAQLLKLFNTEDLRAIAAGQVGLDELAKQLLNS